MKKSNQTNKKILESIDYQFLFIIDMINNETDSENIFLKREIFMEVIKSIAKIEQLANKVKEDLEASELINITLDDVKGIININKKHYDGGNS